MVDVTDLALMNERRHMIRVKQTLVAAFLAFSGMPALADPVANFIFDESVLASLGTGSTLQYEHFLAAPEDATIPGFDKGQIDVVFEDAEDGSRQVVISFDRGQRLQKMRPLPTVGGNPLVMVFLESTARAMAGIAGGSPFYIRNRIKGALMTEGTQKDVTVLVGGKETAVTQVTVQPFANDPNTNRMGQFSQLEMSFTYSQDVPGGIQELRTYVPAATGDAPFYEERIVFSQIEASK